MKRAKISALFLTAAVALLLATCSDGIEKEEFATVSISLGNSEASRVLVWRGNGSTDIGEISYHTYELTVIGREMNPIRLTRNGNTLTGSGVPTGTNQELEIRAYMPRSRLVSIASQLGISLPGDVFNSPEILRAFGVSQPVNINAGNNTINAPVDLYSAMEVGNWKELEYAVGGGRDGDRVEFIFLKDSMDALYTIPIDRPIIIGAESDVIINRGANFTGPFFNVVTLYSNTGDMYAGGLYIGTVPEAGEVNFLNGAITLDGGRTEGLTATASLITVNGTCIIGRKAILQNNNNIFDFDSDGGTTGGGVCIHSGTFTLYGAIKNNSSRFGGGVNMADATFIMEDGAAIEDNSATYGGGGAYVTITSYWNDDEFIKAKGGVFNINGGVIRGNVAPSDAGGVFLTGGTFNMSGGSITGNNCGNASDAGGVTVRGSTIYRYDDNGEPINPPIAVIKGAFNMTKPAMPGPFESIKNNTGGANGTPNLLIYDDATFHSDDDKFDIHANNKNGW